MEEINKGGSTPKKAEGNKEEITTITQEDYDKLDSIYTRIVNASDDLKVLVEELSGERGTVTTWHTIDIAHEGRELSIKGIEKILFGEVK